MQSQPRYILAPYLETPIEVVEAMLDLAGVGADDLVYDLGCGDGRVVITAAQRCRARGVGVDIEAYWIEQARERAELAGVGHRVRFEQVDALQVDLSAASVVFVYLVDWSTQRVAVHLREHCRPGTRVVSHSFGFGTGIDSVQHQVEDRLGQVRRLHLWRIPLG